MLLFAAPSRAGRLFVLWISLAAIGCGGGEEITRTHVKGTVKHNGEPLDDGRILFVPVEGETIGAPVQLTINNGVFNSQEGQMDTRGLVVGKNQVRVFSNKTTGRTITNPDGTKESEQVQFVPKKYNESSELIAEIKPETSELSFDLQF